MFGAKISAMTKCFLSRLLVFLLVNLCIHTAEAQVPDWSDTACNSNIYHLYDDLAAGHAVVLDFTAMWCAPSAISSPILDSLYRTYGSDTRSLRMYNFLVQNQIGDTTTCSNVALYQAQRHITCPGFAACDAIYNDYLAAYHDSIFPLILLIIPNAGNPAASTLVFNSAHDLTNMDSLYFQLDSLLQVNGFSPTAVQEVGDGSMINSFSVYPNPANGKFRMLFNEPDVHGTLKVFDVVGHEVYQEMLPDSGVTTRELSLNLPSGAYFIQVYDGNKRFIQKVVLE